MADKKTIIIGGITGGIGSALARNLVGQGYQVSGFARDKARVDALNDELDTDATTCDATDPEALAACLQDFAKRYGALDAYVHAIGSIFLKPAHMTSPDDWHKTLQLNLTSAFYALGAATKIMQKQSSGSCLFFSTAAAQTGIANHEAIAAAKGGIEAMVRAAAATYSGKGLRINAIAPSLTDTPLAQPIIGGEQARKISEQMHPLHSIGDAEEVASLAAWLVSDQARFVTGQTYVMDGGISTIVPKPKV